MIRDLFHAGDIYAGFTPRLDAVLHGWNDHSAIFNQLLGPDARLVVEVGTWLGASALHLCNAASNAEVVCIDTWLGALEMRGEKRDPDRYLRLKCVNGYPTLYWEFLSNVVRAGKQHQVTPMPFPSLIALRWLKQHGMSPDLIYVDGSHDEPDVRADIAAALELNPGVVCGDDFQPGWPGVMAAVTDLVPEHQVGANHFWWRKFR